MTVGTGVFLSTLIISLLILYWITRDKWNWKLVAIRAALTIFIIGTTITIGFWGYNTYKDRAQKHVELSGVSLSSSISDIKFLKGEPDKINGGSWQYINHTTNKTEYVILIDDQKIRAIIYLGDCISCNNLSSIGIGDSYQTIINKFGTPSRISISEDQMARVISYKKYNVFFQLTKNKVDAFGVYNTNLGELSFQKEHKGTNSKNNPSAISNS